ncbi:MAG: CDP-diacylglycerol--glycerol-3-phosphate 3-phosphatidyltransferase [Oscillospiraceae bacterium]|nr:CDP-diacylglycerol--glycerol-3-phosphate 3-phosphatidyltransferase [Oscillospiraceae bacterium]
MNLPNKLTLLRALLVPVFLVFALIDRIPLNFTAALIVFALASLTDALDGHIARKNNLVTTFGKFLDPLADKVLVISALAVFVDLGIISAVPFVIIIAREFMVSGLRLVAADSRVVVAAGFWGKLKTAFTMASIVFILLLMAVSSDFDWFGFDVTESFEKIFDYITQALIWI